MPRPEDTLDELARLAREDEALHDRLPPELSTPISAEKTAALVGAIQSRITTRTRRRSFLAAGAAVAAMAAGVLLFIGRPGATLPKYEVRVAGGQQSERSSSEHRAELLRLRSGSTLTFELRPQEDYSGAVEAQVVLISKGFTARNEIHVLELSQEQSAAGALRIEVRIPNQVPATGRLTLSVARKGEPAGDDRKLFSWPFERSP
jgi:hypothetical protein